MKDYERHITCETTAAIVVHIREIGAVPARFSGHTSPKPQTLCGMKADWDTRIPLGAATCRSCKAAFGEEHK